ncbi:hypothetical protein CCACVL1_23756 [Corchorus capsularis]|uniref:Uncharacterized protein n=1 Tax=Corchorus capsularis TaxID=210143 RepID=A0A1R3GSS1_COCAP|nr:hypothetical protein CCACVL1_23756 [Corchorus capsularis]
MTPDCYSLDPLASNIILSNPLSFRAIVSAKHRDDRSPHGDISPNGLKLLIRLTA